MRHISHLQVSGYQEALYIYSVSALNYQLYETGKILKMGSRLCIALGSDSVSVNTNNIPAVTVDLYATNNRSGSTSYAIELRGFFVTDRGIIYTFAASNCINCGYRWVLFANYTDQSKKDDLMMMIIATT